MGRPKIYDNLQAFTVLLSPDSLESARRVLVSRDVSLISVVGTNSGLVRYLLAEVVKKGGANG